MKKIFLLIITGLLFLFNPDNLFAHPTFTTPKEGTTYASVGRIPFLNSLNASIADVNRTVKAEIIQKAEEDRIIISPGSTFILPPLRLLSFSASVTNNQTSLYWTTTEEIENDHILLERSENNLVWETIFKEMVSNSIGMRKYEYQDKFLKSGAYYYRLKITTANGAIFYSPVSTVKLTGRPSIALYPNPAQSFILVKNINQDEAIIVFNFKQQIIKSPLKIVDNKTKQLDIQHLPSGVYFVHVKETTLMFIKE